MNRQEAIINLKGIKDSYGDDRDEGYLREVVVLDKEEKEAIDMAIEALQDDWIPVSERLPECEHEVLICTEKKILGKDAYIDPIITPAMYEDGTMLEIESKWSWDMDFDEWDDTEDCGIIPEGWWENRHFNSDEVYNNPVDRNVVAWRPLPKPYKAESEVEK